MRTRKRDRIGHKFRNMMQCICSGDQLRANDMVLAPGSVKVGQKADSGDIEEAESSLRESGSLNYEEARAMLGRYEYQKGNVEAALHVFEGIDINAVTPRIKTTLSRRIQQKRHNTENDHHQPVSIHAASLLLEAIFLKAKSLQALGKFTEAAQSCKVILGIVESSLPDGLPENFGADCKLQETLIKTIELLPELWKLAICPEEAVSSYRRALLYRWNLDDVTTARIQKEFSVYLLYSGSETSPPYLGSETHSFVPKNSLEEAILLLMLLFKKANDHIIVWDPAILDHLSFALSVSGSPLALAHLVEELFPGVISREQMYQTLALCYYGDGDSFASLNLLRKLLTTREETTFVPGLLVASKICGQNPECAEEGVKYARRALENMGGKCNQIVGSANYLLGLSLSEHARLAISYSERITKQSEAIDVLEKAWKLSELSDATIAYRLSIQFAELRKLDSALNYAKELLKLEGGSNLKGWVLMARILSAQKQFVDAETIIDAALEQSVKRDQGQLLGTKAKIQVAQGHLKDATKTYTQLLAVLHLQSKSNKSSKKYSKVIRKYDQHLELETWHDLVFIYISLSSWNDVEACLSKLKAINPYSASRWHAFGSCQEVKGLFKEALEAFTIALSIDPKHVPSLISSATALRFLSNDDKQSFPVIRSFLMQALSLDRMDHSIWYQLGLLYKAQGTEFMAEAVECFEAASVLEDTAPVEPFSK